MSERDNTTALAVAKQIAQFNGQIFAKLAERQRSALMALARTLSSGSCMAYSRSFTTALLTGA